MKLVNTRRDFSGKIFSIQSSGGGERGERVLSRQSVCFTTSNCILTELARIFVIKHAAVCSKFLFLFCDYLLKNENIGVEIILS